MKAGSAVWSGLKKIDYGALANAAMGATAPAEKK